MSAEQSRVEQMEAMLKKSLVTIKKLESEIARNREHSSEAVAIVGMGCRMPGGVSSPEDLWAMLEAGKDAVSLIPEDRWDRDATYDADPLAPGKANTRHGAFLEENVRAFDAGFFGLSPREARSMDPLQRLLLEVTQEAFERAGISTDSVRGSNTGVFLGVGSSVDYEQASLRSGHLESINVYDTTGIPLSTASGRLSYQFDLQGPSFAIDAACSSAIVAIHLAAQSLRNGECDLALAGSANLLLSPELFVGLSKLGSLSPDGVCRAFDDEGNGYVRGEGAGVILLKRLRDAQADGDEILAVVRGSAVVHDGLSNGYTAPNPDAQVRAIRQALKQAGAEPATIGFVESHGVGNTFTDALELQALERGYAGRKGKLYVGSVKPNIGHMEAAVGMAMVAKVIGAFRHGKIPPNINFNKPNSDIDWARSIVEVPTKTLDWKADGPLRAAVHASGYTGTNSHLILEAPPVPVPVTDGKPRPVYPFLLSAHSPEALRGLVSAGLLGDGAIWDQPLANICHTLAAGRGAYTYKLAVAAESAESCREALTAWLADGKHKSVPVSDPELLRSRGVAFLFTGQGAQYHDMCRSLYENEPVFRKEMDRCDGLLKPHLGESIVEVMYGGDKSRIDRTEFTQPALFAVEYALAQLWMNWGIKPVAVAGHSVGEYVAMTVAGVLSLEDAVALIAMRGKLIQSLPEEVGGMAAVLAGEDVVSGYLAGTKVDIAAVNSPKALTISGLREDVDAVVERMKEAKIRAIPLTVSHAFHSYLMEPILKEFERVVAGVSLKEPKIPVMSNVTGGLLSLADLGPEYFSAHIRGTVRFADNVAFLDRELGVDVFLEAGPNPTLAGLAKQTLDKPQALVLHSAKNGQDDHRLLTEAMIQLYLAGIPLDWKAVFHGHGNRHAKWPVYAWQREEYWIDPVHLGGTGGAGATQATVGGATAQTVHADNLMDIMQQVATGILGLPAGSKLDVYKSMREQGFDSMMSGEFLAIMEKYLGAKLEMSLIHVYGDLNSLYNYFVKEVLGDEVSVTLSDVMFNSAGAGPARETDGDWHTIRDEDGRLLRLFKKFDRMLGVNDK